MAGKKGRSGRKPMSVHRHNTLNLLRETSPHAAMYLKECVKGELGTYTETVKKKDGTVIIKTDIPIPVDPGRLDACKYVINQDLGMPRQKIEFDATREAVRIAQEMGLPATDIPSIIQEFEKVLKAC